MVLLLPIELFDDSMVISIIKKDLGLSSGPGVCMILLCMMGFVEDQEVNLMNTYERVHKTLIKDFCGANDNHIVLEMLFPDVFGP